MKIGVLALQGAFAEHISILRNLEVDTMPVRLPQQLVELDGLVIPGGESTTITRLLQSYDLMDKISNLANNGLPIFGTCAGMIVLAREISDSTIQPIGVMAIKVRRNAFGRQRESFESELSIPVLGEKSFHGVFIRAPVIEQANSNVEVIARLADSQMVAARQGKLLACAFHPELTDDTRLHKYFLDIISGKR
jgi:5'-phosphate synthase pdxT subunit